MDKTLYFLRHATAQLRQPELPDRPRQLIAKGQLQAQKVAALLKRQRISPQLVLTSPYPRAVQTAEIVCREAALPAWQACDWLALETPTAQGLSALQQLLPLLPQQTLLVGHEPDFSQLISHLLGMPTPALQIKKASLCALDYRNGRFDLAWLLPCALMK